MENFLLIDFKDFKATQVCEFVVEKLHSKVRDKIQYLNTFILSNSLQKNVYNSEFHRSYLELVDTTHQLIKLEKHILFEFVNTKEAAQDNIVIPSESVKHIRQLQYDIKHLLLFTRVLFQELEREASYQTVTSIIEMELLNLETALIQWFHIVNRNVLSHSEKDKGSAV